MKSQSNIQFSDGNRIKSMANIENKGELEEVKL
jgi:hypothetical protein